MNKEDLINLHKMNLQRLEIDLIQYASNYKELMVIQNKIIQEKVTLLELKSIKNSQQVIDFKNLKIIKLNESNYIQLQQELNEHQLTIIAVDYAEENVGFGGGKVSVVFVKLFQFSTDSLKNSIIELLDRSIHQV